MHCGAPLAASELPERDPRVYTPAHLANKILKNKSALEGERKLVTVLFADIHRSMELASAVDAEEWHRIMDRFFAILAEGVHRFEGTINQFTGDGIMALFGAPIAHEDHAQRACYTALHLTEKLRGYADELRLERGINFGVRIGLNSGEVVVGKIGDDLRMDYTAQGPTVGLAARMEQIAAPDRVYLTQHTARLVKGFFELRDLGESNIKGVTEPLRVYELQGAGPIRTRLDLSRSRGFFRFVGRADEMARLKSALERASGGNGQIVGVVGEAGVGKSRLCLEFVEHVRAQGLQVYEAHCPPHGKAAPLLPARELLRAYFGISEQDSDAMARQKIAGRLLLLDRSFGETLPVLFDFLGVPDPERPSPLMQPEARQRQLFEFVRRLVKDRSESEAGVILVDDLHWVDPGSEAFLAQLVEAVNGTRTLLLLNFRPEYDASWVRKSYYQQLALVPLGREAIDELLAHLLGADPSLAGLSDLMRERTGGNPFFIEEVVTALEESGSLDGVRGAYRLIKPVGQIQLPSTVQSLLAARIDRLAEREKQVLQTAAVIGKEFAEPILKQVIELPDTDLAAALGVLQASEFIYEQQLFPEAEYAFKHPLTQEVAYTSQLAERRREKHAAVARAVAELYPDKLDEQAALIAHHWEEAGQALEAARWHARAAPWVMRSDIVQSIRHWQKVYERVASLPQAGEAGSLRLLACVQILVVGGWRLGLSQAEEEALFSDGRALATERGDTAALATLAIGYSTRLGNLGNARGYVEHAIEAARLADETGDLELRAVALMGLVYSHWSAGRLAEALDYVDRAVELIDGDVKIGATTTGFSIWIFLLTFQAAMRGSMGRIEESRRGRARGLQLAREHDQLENLAWGLGGTVFDAFYSGDLEGTHARAREALEISEKLGSPFVIAFSLAALGNAHLYHEEWEQAIDVIERALELTRSRRTGLETESVNLANLARAYLGAGRREEARRMAEEAVKLGRQGGSGLWELQAHLARAQVLIALDGADGKAAIEAEIDCALELVDRTGARGVEPLILEQRAELARLLGDEAVYVRELRKAHRLFVEMGATGHARRVAARL